MRRFTADVSHELRTPLTAIRSVGEVGLRGHRDEAAYRSIIGSMLEEVDRLASLVDRLLTLSRAETGQAKLSREAVDLSALADDVVSHLAVLAEEKRQTLSIDRQASPVVAADRLVLRQALINLVDNAIKFTPVGGAGAHSDHARRRRTRSSRSIDSGPGISSDARERIFDRFYRGQRRERQRHRTGAVARQGRGRGARRPPDAGRHGADRQHVPYLNSRRNVGRTSPAEHAIVRSRSRSERVTVRHLTRTELEAGLESIRNSPSDDGVVELIVSRPHPSAREVLEHAQLDPAAGLVGDSWANARCPRRTRRHS